MPDVVLAGTQLLAVEFLERCMQGLEPLAALTGAAGTGKTIALNTALARRESAGDRIIRVNNFVAGPLSLHRTLAASLGVADAGELSAEELEPVLRRAVAETGQAEPPVLAVDDAQSLLPETLRYLCLLAGLREAGRPLFRILLVGRPGFTVRQPMPLHFTLEAMQPNAMREMAQHRFAAVGVIATDETIHGIVQSAQGNLRTFDALLRARIEEAGASSRKRMIVTDLRAVAPPRTSRRARRRSFGAWLVVPALLVIGAAGAAIVYRDDLTGRQDDPTAVAVSAPPVQLPTAASPGRSQAGPSAAPSPPAPSPQANVGAPSSAPRPAPAAVVAPSAPAPATSSAVRTPPASGDAGHAAVPTPTVPPAVEPATPAPIAAPAPVAEVPLPPADIAAPAALPQPQPQQAQQLPRAATPAPASPAPVQATSFRVYNISACHRGFCPRWSVTNLDQRSHFVAAFDLSALHLDRDTLRHLREGAVDLIVSGSVTGGGQDGRTLVAATLQGVAPHRGLLHPSSSEPTDLAAPPLTQSPPPGFLAMPISNAGPASQPRSPLYGP